MARLYRVKRHLVREAVRENVDEMRGAPPRVLRPAHRLRRTALRGAGLAVTLALLIGSLNALSGGSAPPDATTPAARAAAFPAPRPVDFVAFPLGIKKVVLDPGHGGTDPGAETAAGQSEKEITLDVARRLRGLLQAASLDVAMTRDRDETVSLRQRAVFANTEKADLFVSVHVNSIPTHDCRAVETYYLGPTDDPAGERLAGAENRESGYSLADFRRLLEGVYVHVRRAESRRLADAVQGALVAELASINPQIRDNGVKTAPFLVLVATESPGILAEVSCLSSDEEAQRLADPAYRQKMARGLFLGIRAYADAHNQTARQGG